MTGIIEAIVALLKTIPIFDKWFSKSELDKENEAKRDVDKEHNDNSETKRPSGDFWEHTGA